MVPSQWMGVQRNSLIPCAREALPITSEDFWQTSLCDIFRCSNVLQYASLADSGSTRPLSPRRHLEHSYLVIRIQYFISSSAFSQIILQPQDFLRYVIFLGYRPQTPQRGVGLLRRAASFNCSAAKQTGTVTDMELQNSLLPSSNVSHSILANNLERQSMNICTRRFTGWLLPNLQKCMPFGYLLRSA